MPKQEIFGGVVPALSVPKITLLRNNNNKRAKDGEHTLSFPLDVASIERISASGTWAPVAVNKTELLNLDVRKCYQLHPPQFRIEGPSLTDQPAFQSLLTRIQAAMGIGSGNELVLQAHLYKFLMYEPGCFFQKHRDHERLPNMVGTLILELPSVYEGGELLVWPSSSTNKTDVTTDDGAPMTFQQSTLEEQVSFVAFSSSCSHEVKEVVNGHRCAFVFTLTAPTATSNTATSNTANGRSNPDNELGLEDCRSSDDGALPLPDSEEDGGGAPAGRRPSLRVDPTDSDEYEDGGAPDVDSMDSVEYEDGGFPGPDLFSAEGDY